MLLCFILGIYLVHAVPINVASPKRNWVTYEAENAFSYKPNRPTSCEIASAPKKVSGTYVPLSTDAYVIFTVNIPRDGSYPVTLHGFACDSQSTIVNVEANGLSMVLNGDLNLENGEITYMIVLRTGLNTINYKISGGSVAFDFISIKGGIEIAKNGATIPYEEIEAEDSSYSGTLIGPGRQYCTLPSEASGRKAIQFTGSGGYVEFSPTLPFNAVVVRFSIPNTANGKGQAADLTLLVNGNQVTTLNVTSYYSWVYGAYPFSKNPGDGSPHHFYDDVRYFFGENKTYPAGTKVRLVGASPVSYTIDLADFYNVGAPYAQPANYVSVLTYGADPSGLKDSFAPFNSAIAAAGSSGQGVWIPAGKYTFSSRITINKITIRGAGPWYTECHGYDFGFFGTYAPNPSTGVNLYDFAIFGETITRVDAETSSGAGGSLDSSIIQNIWIEHNKCGMWLDGPFDSLFITGVTIRNTFADGINFHQGVTNSIVEQTIIRNTGDDCLAMWPQNPGTYQNNVFRFNTVSLPVLANNIAIYGGQDNSATDNLCLDTIVEGGGLQTGTRFGSVELSGTTLFARNTLIRCGGPSMYDPESSGFGQIWLYSDSDPITTPVIFADINMTDSYYQGVGFYQSQMSNLNFTNVYIDTADYAFEERVSGSMYAAYVVAVNISTAGQWNCGLKFEITYGPGNSGWNSTKCV